jgi:hypothetical protein
MGRMKSIILAVFAIVLAGTMALPAVTASAASSASLSIVPKKNYVIESGKSINDTLVIRNIDQNAALDLTLRVVDFTYTDDSGTASPMLDENAPQTTWSLRPFLTLPSKVTIGPGESKTIDMSISIPANHGAGSYYSAIMYSSGAPAGGNVGLSASGMTLAFVQVPGQVNQDLSLERLGGYKLNTPATGGSYVNFAIDQPEAIAFTLVNQGNVTESPVGSITMKDMFGRETVITNINPSGSLALIGQTRTFVSCIKLQKEDVDFNNTTAVAETCATPGLWPGYYSVTLNAFYGQNGNRTQDIIGHASFWYMPVWFIILLIIVLATAALLIWRAVVKMQYSRHGRRIKRSKR